MLISITWVTGIIPHMYEVHMYLSFFVDTLSSQKLSTLYYSWIKIDHYYYTGQTTRLSDPSGIGLTWLLVRLPDTTSSQPNLVSD